MICMYFLVEELGKQNQCVGSWLDRCVQEECNIFSVVIFPVLFGLLLF